MREIIEGLLGARGIESAFVDAWGIPATVKDETKVKLLNAMGYKVDDDQAFEQQVEDDFVRQWMLALNPVQVIKHDEDFVFPLRLSIEMAAQKLVLLVQLEDASIETHEIEAVDHQLINVVEIEDEEFHEYAIALDVDLPMGYHKLSVQLGDLELASSSIIKVPQRCFIPDDIEKGKKIWGLSVQLYCVRSRSNWGIGDFTDLTFLVKQAASQGADFVGLNPIHELYPANPDICSPYGPSSRRWLNYLYIDVAQVPEFENKAVQAWFNDNAIGQQLEILRAVDYVDYKGVAAIKLAALNEVFTHYSEKYFTKNTKQNKIFKAFITQGGESLQTLAVFEALQESLNAEGKDCWGWPVFPDEFKAYDMPSVAKFAKQNKNRVNFYLFLQWHAALQFEAASNAASEAGMLIGLYRDLAVGVSEGSAEIWGNKDLYCIDASIGAPPDILGPLGQNWGLPPMDPIKLYEQAYQPIIDLFSSNMHASGALRIDHVMALLRLWWVYRGDNAKLGGYVCYPVEDLLGILALESQRNQSLVIGEDLGTVPEQIRSKLAENGMYSYRVFFFEQAEDGGFYAPDHYPEQSMATLTTHDMPTLIGYWHCDDLALGERVGLYPDADVLASLYDIRHENKQHILDTLHGHHSISNSISHDVHDVGMTTELNYGMQTHMASGSSALLSLQLEDWLEMDKPVNIPGTFNEYPNWKRKLSRNLEDIFEDDAIVNLAKNLTNQRSVASKIK
ncbi:4-alpha-glucanotransferase [Brumicola pallidula]|jgi:4-alpha-glucanotransferase|uniref:4-alpha-glucanotransferase n=1 Tax=Brumicola pallidula DSM 14239 = ACAM 615 TaxID=1121922 RepID=K6ZDB1_9ALTE|nr:4-alpha-glucanotransferase [Glaciecola pallidula]GAC28302.1 4-alpha-glucanotransferase [Glaciecola pallidula DSM 14239 = ACAM 615]